MCEKKELSVPIISINRYDIFAALDDNEIHITNEELIEIADITRKSFDEEFWDEFSRVFTIACKKVIFGR